MEQILLEAGLSLMEGREGIWKSQHGSPGEVLPDQLSFIYSMIKQLHQRTRKGFICHLSGLCKTFDTVPYNILLLK